MAPPATTVQHGSAIEPLGLSFPAALRDADSDRPQRRAAAAERLAMADAEQRAGALVALRPLLDDPVGPVRYAAIAALGLLRDGDAIDEVVERFADLDASVREVAVIAAAQIGGETAVEALRRALHGGTPEMRFQAVAGVAERCPAEAAAELRGFLGDPDGEVRGQTARALASLGDGGSADAIAKLLDDRAARFEAALALASLGDARGVPVLCGALENGEQIFEAATALGELGAAEASDSLARIAGRFFGSLFARAACAAALIRVGDPRGVPALQSVLGGLRSEARSYAVQLAGELRHPELLPHLLRLAERPKRVDPTVLAEALAAYGTDYPEAQQAWTGLAGAWAGQGRVGQDRHRSA